MAGPDLPLLPSLLSGPEDLTSLSPLPRSEASLYGRAFQHSHQHQHVLEASSHLTLNCLPMGKLLTHLHSPRSTLPTQRHYTQLGTPLKTGDKREETRLGKAATHSVNSQKE